MCATSSQAAITSPAARRAPRRRRGSDLAFRHRSGCECQIGTPLAGDQRDPCGRAARRRSRTRATGTSNSAPIEARTALGPYGSALPGPSATLPAPNASAERSTVPTLPGSLTPHSARQTGPTGRRRPALAVDADRARAGAELRHAGEHVRRDRDAVEPAALGHVDRLGLPARAGRGLDQVLALGDEQPQLVAPLAAGELADLLELFVVGAGDRHGSGQKKGAAPIRRGAREVGLVVAGQAVDASRALSANRRKVSGSRTAMSASTLRSSSMPASLRPCMNVP